MELDVHLASEDEILTAHANVHEAWGGGLPLEEHVARRVASPHHRRATIWVGSLGGEVVTTLGCRPVVLDLGDGVRRAAFGLASVHTVPAHRRCGHAGALCRTVVEHERAHRRRLGLLFSEIDPRFYEPFGFTPLPASVHETRDLAALARGPELAFAPLAAEAGLALLAPIHAASLAGTPHVVRDEEAWEALLSMLRGAEFYVFLDGGEPCGYARTHDGPVRAGDEDGLALQELCLLAGVDEAAAWRALAAEAVARGHDSLHAWCPPPAELAASFTARPRRGVPMLADLDGIGAARALSRARLFLGDSF